MSPHKADFTDDEVADAILNLSVLLRAFMDNPAIDTYLPQPLKDEDLLGQVILLHECPCFTYESVLTLPADIFHGDGLLNFQLMLKLALLALDEFFAGFTFDHMDS